MSEGAKTRSSRKLLGAESSATRAALMAATLQLMQEEGYGAVTSRRIAEKAGLKHQLIYYYFDTLDDLFLAVLRDGAEQTLERLAALETDQPLRALWNVFTDPRVTAFTAEFMALAGHNEVIRAEITGYAERFRRLQTEALERRLAARGIEAKIPPVLLTMLMVSLSSVVVREASLGISLGHAEAEAYIEQCLRQFEETGSLPAAL